jgi:hypothetical protein
MPFKKEDGEDGETPRCKLAKKSPHKQGGSMKCTHLIESGDISACSALDKPYVPSLFELVEYCKTIDHKKCPFYLRGIICVNQAESNTRRASL